VSLDCVIYRAFYSILFRGAVFPGHDVQRQTIDTRLLCVLLAVVTDSCFMPFRFDDWPNRPILHTVFPM